MKLALLTTDNREEYREYDNAIPWFGTAPEALLQGFARLAEVEIHVVSCTQSPLKSPPKLAENIFFHSLYVPKIGWMRTAYQGCIRATRAKLKEIKPDLVHGQGTERNCAISAVFSGFPNVVTVHGNMAALSRHLRAPVGSAVWLAGQLEKFTLARTQGVFCNSAYTEELVRQRNSRVWRVPNALRTAFFAPIPERTKKATVRFVNVGVISPRKRQVELLALFKRLHQNGRALHIEFIGHVDAKDPYGRKFLDEIRDANLSGYASYAGPLKTENLIAALDRAESCVHFPSEEAFGLIVAEAMARNLKFFGSKVGGIIDISEGVKGAELFPPDDWTSLEQTLARWMDADCPRYSNGAETMHRRYHPRVICEKHLEIYGEVIAMR